MAKVERSLSFADLRFDRECGYGWGSQGLRDPARPYARIVFYKCTPESFNGPYGYIVYQPPTHENRYRSTEMKWRLDPLMISCILHELNLQEEPRFPTGGH
jgi:hypothetical protein